MTWHPRLLRVLAALILGAASQGVDAADIPVSTTTSLGTALILAAPGDRLLLEAGTHRGPVFLTKSISLIGHPGAAIAGNDTGTVITVQANNVTVSGLEISGSGSSHQDLDSGVKITKGVAGAVISNNRIVGNLYGVDVHGGIDTQVRGNTIIGRTDHRMNARGNGVYVWNAPGTVVAGNIIRQGRDGIFVNTSRDNRFIDNQISDLRFAIHYMYTHDSVIAGNRSLGNHAGYALMNSRDLVVENNVSEGDRDHGIMLNYVNNTLLKSNLVVRGSKKCLFMYNANKNELVGNIFSHCPIGIHFTAGSERNLLSGNGFIGNRTQVKYVGSRWLEWSSAERGNYWSDHTAFDLNGDDLADMPYRPNDLVDHILWTQPSARLLLGSPAIQLLRWVQSKFPSLLPGGVIDSRPMMKPPLAVRQMVEIGQ